MHRLWFVGFYMSLKLCLVGIILYEICMFFHMGLKGLDVNP